MLNSGIPYEAGLARIEDLRRQADERRLVQAARREPERVRSANGRGPRGHLREALATLSPRRPARA